MTISTFRGKWTHRCLTCRVSLAKLLCVTVLGFVFTICIIINSVEKWKTDKLDIAMASYLFLNNTLARSSPNTTCQIFPIDVVYTWVNGSDPMFIHGLEMAKLERNDPAHYYFTKHYHGETRKETTLICPFFENCVLSRVVLVSPSLPPNISLQSLKMRDSQFSTLSRIENLRQNLDIFVLRDLDSARRWIERKRFTLDGIDYSTAPGYLSPDHRANNAITLKNMHFLFGAQHMSRDRLGKQISANVSAIDVYDELDLAVFETSDSAGAPEENLAMYLSGNSVTKARLLLDFSLNNSDAFGVRRFRDFGQLRYSLRSLEAFAPWIRNVYILTNGQIPNWLNLSNPRVKLVTHEEVFLDPSQLPTFSSGAIEPHLHRIPGLSRHFIYINDDMMLGQAVSPDDFYTCEHGTKIHMAWNVPACHSGCSDSSLHNGICDHECNNLDCQWDGGDCHDHDSSSPTEGVGSKKLEKGAAEYIDGEEEFGLEEDSSTYCHKYCKDSLLANAICDVQCNIKACGFDVGDCGVSNFHELPSIMLEPENTSYALPISVREAYINLTDFLAGDRTITKVWCEADGVDWVVRMLVTNLEHQVMTLLMLEEEANTLNITMTVVEADTSSFNYSFTVDVDTRPEYSLTPVNYTNLNPEPMSIKSNYMADIASLNQRKDTSTVETKNYISAKKNSRSILQENDNGAHSVTRQKRSPTGRHLLFTFSDPWSDSVHHVNRLLNTEYKYASRMVPAHAPFFIDKEIQAEMYKRFQQELLVTASHRLRSSFDLEFSMLYSHFLMNEPKLFNAVAVFNFIDADGSGTWDDKELETLSLRIRELATSKGVDKFVDYLLECSSQLTEYDYRGNVISSLAKNATGNETFHVSKNLILSCTPVLEILKKNFQEPKYPFEIIRGDYVSFLMITSDAFNVKKLLLDVLKHPRKFICLNDDISDWSTSDTVEIIGAIQRDFYETMFPSPSQFELANSYVNVFLHVSELNTWKEHKQLTIWTAYILFIFWTILLVMFCRSKVFRKTSKNQSSKQVMDLEIISA